MGKKQCNSYMVKTVKCLERSKAAGDLTKLPKKYII